MTDFGHRFDPALAEVHPSVRAALVEAAGTSPELADQALTAVLPHLQALFGTRQLVLTLPAPFRLLREMALHGTIRQRALVLVSGPDGEELARTCEALGRDVIRAAVAPGRTLDPGQLSRFLAPPVVDTVVLAHVESGTGIRAPLAELAAVVRTRPDLLLFVDARHSLGAEALASDAWGLDFVCGASEGPLGLMPGHSFALLSPRWLERARADALRGVGLDLVAHHDALARGQQLLPSPPPLTMALVRQLTRIVAEEGLERRGARYRDFRARLEQWAIRCGWVRLVAPAERAAAAVTVLEFDAGPEVSGLRDRLHASGWLVGAGLTGSQLTIGHMGDHEPAHLEALLAAIAGLLTPP